ncbi:MAG: hypothetical protein ABSE73_02325 [Planctomycetota bacterium]
MSSKLPGIVMICACSLSLSTLAGQADNPAQPAPPQQGKGQNANPGPGPGRGPGPGFGPGPMDFMRGHAAEMISRMTGLDIANIAAGTKDPKLETLPLGSSRRLVINVPVGGIENPAGTGAGWKMEAVLSLSADQQGALQMLRDEYDKQKHLLQQELGEAQKQLAQKAVQLRLQYEERANGLLAGADKETKLKLDALTAEAGAKSDLLVKDALNLHDPEDPGQMFALITYLREKMTTLITQTENNLLQLVPAGRKAVIEGVLQNNAAVRQRMVAFGGGGPGGPGGGPQEEKPVKPPAPPGAETNQF